MKDEEGKRNVRKRKPIDSWIVNRLFGGLGESGEEGKDEWYGISKGNVELERIYGQKAMPERDRQKMQN